MSQPRNFLYLHFLPDFMNKDWAYVIEKARASGRAT